MPKPRDQKGKILYLHRKGGKSLTEIAQLLKLTPSAVKYHIDYSKDKEIELTIDELAKLDVLLEKKKENIEVASLVHDNLKDLKEYYNHIMKDVSHATIESVELMKNIVTKAKLMVEGGNLKVSELLQITTILEKSSNIFQMTGVNLGISLKDIAKKQANQYLTADDGNNVIINILSAPVPIIPKKDDNTTINDIEQIDDATTKH